MLTLILNVLDKLGTCGHGLTAPSGHPYGWAPWIWDRQAFLLMHQWSPRRTLFPVYIASGSEPQRSAVAESKGRPTFDGGICAEKQGAKKQSEAEA